MQRYTTAEAAEWLHVTVATIHNYVKTGWLIPTRKIGSAFVFSREELERCRAAGPRYRGGRPQKAKG